MSYPPPDAFAFPTDSSQFCYNVVDGHDIPICGFHRQQYMLGYDPLAGRGNPYPQWSHDPLPMHFTVPQWYLNPDEHPTFQPIHQQYHAHPPQTIYYPQLAFPQTQMEFLHLHYPAPRPSRPPTPPHQMIHEYFQYLNIPAERGFPVKAENPCSICGLFFQQGTNERTRDFFFRAHKHLAVCQGKLVKVAKMLHVREDGKPKGKGGEGDGSKLGMMAPLSRRAVPKLEERVVDTGGILTTGGSSTSTSVGALALSSIPKPPKPPSAKQLAQILLTKSSLEADPYATNVLPRSIDCVACGKTIPSQFKRDYSITAWNYHKSHCPEIRRGERARREPAALAGDDEAKVQTSDVLGGSAVDSEKTPQPPPLTVPEEDASTPRIPSMSEMHEFLQSRGQLTSSFSDSAPLAHRRMQVPLAKDLSNLRDS
ncbi:hypothetical protein JAAARDRAFT_31488 [Jaapia argillacea MUCL 33604]|uniref:Uncharacterized protein n=1 Tax=Jaapia argillacea MUCL 33604 TaxID=933084 RepID=A0A067Q4N0_9AGAM|nr:hypothetical protein JAAARDRAFT_31488 [Jaapia argillacea MUCL 33604]